MANTATKLILAQTSRNSLKGRGSNRNKLSKFYDENQALIDYGLDEAKMNAGGKGHLPSVLSTARNDILFDRLVKTKLNKMGTDIDNATAQELSTAINKVIVYDAYRSEFLKDQFMNRWVAEMEDKVMTGKRGRPKTSDRWKQFQKETGWKGSASDYASIYYDEAEDIYIYNSPNGKRYKLYFDNSPQTPEYEEI